MLIWLGCPNCFNKEVQDFNYGEEFTEETIQKLIELSAPSWISGISLLGGEPLHPRNRTDVLTLARRFKEVYPEKSIWLWTGFLIEEVFEDLAESDIDVVVDGKFVEDLKDFRLKYRGSSNQRVINLKETIRTGDIILYEGT